jgi:hypothetical protein
LGHHRLSTNGPTMTDPEDSTNGLVPGMRRAHGWYHLGRAEAPAGRSGNLPTDFATRR